MTSTDTNCKIFKGDNFHFVNDNSIDFILTDPPFNISKKTNFATYEKNTVHSHQFDGDAENNWDSYSHEEFLSIIDGWAREWERVLTKRGNFAIFCADAYISHLWEALKRNGLQPRRVITWRKNNAVPVNRASLPMSACEYLIVGVKDGRAVFNADVPTIDQDDAAKILEATLIADKVSTIVYSQMQAALLAPDALTSLFPDANHVDRVKRLAESVLLTAKKDVTEKIENYYKTNDTSQRYLQGCVPNYLQNPLKTGGRLHPTEKPVALLKFLVALYSNADQTILDSFGGSGSTGEAALSLGRKVILVEREAVFYDKLHARLLKFTGDLQEILEEKSSDEQ